MADFISDLHLSPDMPATVAAWGVYLAATRADAVFILGDLFEAWVGDDALTLPFEARCADALAAAARRRRVFVMRGNRDFLLGRSFFDSTGTVELLDPVAVHAPGISGQPLVLTHGDAWCVADVEYLQFRALVRSPAWQHDFLAKPLSERRAIGAQMRTASREHQRRANPVTYADVDSALALESLRQVGATVLVHGHTHRPGSEHYTEGWQRHVLSDWDLDDTVTPRAEVLRWAGGHFRRLTPQEV